jgi:Amt family ammonium transporter
MPCASAPARPTATRSSKPRSFFKSSAGIENLSPFDLSLAVVGTGLLWVGWFGFNGGSALSASPRAVMAIIATHLAASSGALVWGGIEWWSRRKPSVLGMISGAVAGLGTITPASGFVAPWHGIIIAPSLAVSATGPALG